MIKSEKKTEKKAEIKKGRKGSDVKSDRKNRKKKETEAGLLSTSFNKKIGSDIENGIPNFKDLLLPEMIDRSNPDHLQVDNKFVRSFTITGYPKRIAVAWADNLYDYHGDMDIALHVKPIDERAALDQLTNKITQFQAQLATEMEKGSNRNITKLQTQIQELIEERSKAEQNYISLFGIQMAVNLYCNSLEQLNTETKLLTTSMRGKKIQLTPLYMRQDQGYKTALPYGKSWLQKNFRNFSSEGLTACFPFYNSEIAHQGGVFLGVNTQTRTPIYIDFYNRKLLESSSILVLGMPGSGKTFLTSLVCMRSTLDGIKTAIVDPEGEYRDIALALGGANIKIAPGGTIPNPFDISEEEILDGEDRPTGEKTVNIQEKIIDLLNLIGVMMGGNFTNEQKSLVSFVIAKTYSDFGITSNPDSLYNREMIVNDSGELMQSGVKRKMPVFSDFYDRLVEMNNEEGIDLSTVVNTLKMFRRDGVFGLFDCETPSSLENLSDTSVVNFDVSALTDDTLRPIGMYVALSWCMEKFSKQDVRVRKRVVCDEAWMLVKKSLPGSEYTSHFLENGVRRFRKRNCGLWISSQNFNEFTESAQGEAILNNVPMQIFFKQNFTDIDAVQEKFKLSGGEKNFLTTAQKGNFLLKIGRESTTGYAFAFNYEKYFIEKKFSSKLKESR